MSPRSAKTCCAGNVPPRETAKARRRQVRMLRGAMRPRQSIQSLKRPPSVPGHDAEVAEVKGACAIPELSIDFSYNARAIDLLTAMETITVSPKFQVVIPKSIRDSLKLLPGQKVQAILYDNRIELIPVRPIKKMRGFLKGIDTSVPRERDRT